MVIPLNDFLKPKTDEQDRHSGLSEFHDRIQEGKKDLENVSNRHLGTRYCGTFLKL